MTLIEEYMPRYDVVERHHTLVHASAVRVYDAIERTNFAQSGLVRLLLGLRRLPSALLHGAAGLRELRASAPRISLSSMEEGGFRVLARRPPEEIAIGVEGQFWRLDGARCTREPESFRASAPAPGTARGVWDFRVVAAPGGGVQLSTETRVLCADDATRRRFLPYWTLIRPGSGLIRRAMLASIKQVAEEPGGTT